MILKRLICGLVALVFIFLGIFLSNNDSLLRIAVAFLCFIGGVVLLYVSIKQTLPSFTFWIILLAISLTYVFLLTNESVFVADFVAESDIDNQSTLENEVAPAKNLNVIKKKKKKKKKALINLSSYPHISGPAEVIRANVFYISGRYVRLFGVDAPDNDQLCADNFGVAYNCGELAVSWIKNWIDNNPIDCYIFKIEPKGKDLATCMWGKYDIGAALVRSGWGVSVPKETSIYKPYEMKAKQEASGLWQGTFYSPEDWRDIKRQRNDFTIRRSVESSGDEGFFGNIGSWFK